MFLGKLVFYTSLYFIDHKATIWKKAPVLGVGYSAFPYREAETSWMGPWMAIASISTRAPCETAIKKHIRNLKYLFYEAIGYIT